MSVTPWHVLRESRVGGGDVGGVHCSHPALAEAASGPLAAWHFRTPHPTPYAMHGLDAAAEDARRVRPRVSGRRGPWGQMALESVTLTDMPLLDRRGNSLAKWRQKEAQDPRMARPADGRSRPWPPALPQLEAVRGQRFPRVICGSGTGDHIGGQPSVSALSKLRDASLLQE